MHPVAAQTITPAKALDATALTKVTLSTEINTTLLFPSPICGLSGLGLVPEDPQNNAQNGQQRPGLVGVQVSEGSPMIVLHALTPSAHVVMTVTLDDKKLYLYDLRVGSNPDAAVTFVPPGQDGGKAREVTTREVLSRRPRTDDAHLIDYYYRAHNAPAIRETAPELYQGYSFRPANYRSDSGTALTVVNKIHRFSRDDVIVLEGTVHNETPTPITFDGRAVQAVVAQQSFPSRLTHCQQPVPANAMVPIVVILQGGLDGVSRANLSINNEFRIYLGAVNGQAPLAQNDLKSRYDTAEHVIPRTQTGAPVKSD